MAPEGATVEDCAEQLGIAGARLADVFETFDELVRSEKLMRITGDRYIAAIRDTRRPLVLSSAKI